MIIKQRIAEILAGITCFIFGLFFSIVAIMIYIKNDKIISKGIETKGRVIELIYDYKNEKYNSLITYKDANGYEVATKDLVGTKPARHTIGQELKLYYSKTNPHEVLVDDFASIYIAPLIFGGFGALFGMFGVLVFRNLYRH